ncbi:MAG: hypothetical protein K2J77_02955 [Oscillospiraceae bacterium]|nr:hypothetical protein [Oscillospiraceae bacterium]
MAKKKNKQNIPNNQKKNAGSNIEESYYGLKTDAVDRLINAKNAPPVSDKELEKYTHKRKLRIPQWLKVVLIKLWFAGAVCYFVMWGLGLMISGLDLIAVLAVALGIVTDLMTNNAVRHFAPSEDAGAKWLMFPKKKFWTFFANIGYAIVLLFFVIQSYTIINTILTGTAPDKATTIAVGVEPILFGLLIMGFDVLFVTIKNNVVKAFKNAMDKANGAK